MKKRVLNAKRKNKTIRTIVVIRYDNGRLKYSRPCLQCLITMKKRGVKRVVYSTGDDLAPLKLELVSEMTPGELSSLSRAIAKSLEIRRNKNPTQCV